MATADVRAFRRAVLRRDVPSMLQWSMAIYGGVTVIDTILRVNTVTDVLIDVAVLLVILANYLVVRRTPVSDAVLPWLVAIVCIVMIFALSAELTMDPARAGAGFADLLLVMVAAGPLSLEYLPTATVGAALFVAFRIHEHMWDPGEASAWFAVVAASIGLSLILLRVRHLGIDQLRLVTEQVRDAAWRDPLTGLLNRRGLHELAEPLRGFANREQLPVFALMLDVDGLKVANDEYGHDFGDEVIVTVARAIESSARDSDLVCRWGGDEFVVLGVGDALAVGEFERRVTSAAVASGIDVKRWVPCVTGGAATADANAWDLDALLARADEAMYRRRLAHRDFA